MQKTKQIEGWKEVELGDICEVFNGKTPSVVEKREKGIPILKIKDVDKNEKFRGKFDSFVDIDFYNKYSGKIIKDGDTLILNAAHNSAYVGTKTFFVENLPDKTIATGEWLIVRANSRFIDNKFKHFIMVSSFIKNQIKEIVKGIHLYPKDVKLIKIFLPPLSTQKQIVKILEEAKKLIQKRRDADDLTEEYLESVFYEIFDTYLKDKNKFHKITEFVSNDKHSIKAGPFGSSLKKECYVESGYKIYGQEQVIKDNLNFGDYYISKEKYKELESYKIQEGDILISLVGTYGKISIVPKSFQQGIINPRLMKITLDKKKMNPIFFKFLFNSLIIKTELENASHGGTMDILNVGIIKRTGFPLPPLQLQENFASIVEEVENLKEKQKQSKEEINQMFDSLMKQAFNGELVK
jgi:type I restriction enzyme, S subunit